MQKSFSKKIILKKLKLVQGSLIYNSIFFESPKIGK